MRGGDDPSDEELVELFVRAERVAARIVGVQRAEDVAAEALTRLVAAWPHARGHAQGWVAKVSANLAIDDLRRRDPAARLARRPDPVAEFETTALDRIELRALLDRLPPRQRQAVVLHHLAGLSEDEVAVAMQVSVNTVRTHLERGFRALRSDRQPEKAEVRHAPE